MARHARRVVNVGPSALVDEKDVVLGGAGVVAGADGIAYLERERSDPFGAAKRFGSTTHHVVREATCPVLAVRQRSA